MTRLHVFALLLAVGAARVVSGHDEVRIYGQRFYHPQLPKEYMRTYVVLPADHDAASKPLAVGVQLTNGFVDRASSLPDPMQIPIPLGASKTFNYTAFEGNLDFPKVGTNPFNFVYWGFGFNGHPSVGVYDVPHFDFHFMFPSQQQWWAEWSHDKHGPCFGANEELFRKSWKPVPSTCWPGPVDGPYRPEGMVWAMGVHLIDYTGPEWLPVQRRFKYAQIYGQYDGSIAYFEPMVAQKTMQKPGFKECKTLTHAPTHMPVATELPSKLCMQKADKTFRIEYRDFTTSGAGCTAVEGAAGGAYTGPTIPGCIDMRPV